MRTRPAKPAARFSDNPVVSGNERDSDMDESATPGRGAGDDDDGDDDFMAESGDSATPESEAEDVYEGGDGDSSASYSSASHSGASSDGTEGGPGGRRRPPERKRWRPKAYDAIATYPLEFRTTRTNYGLLNRWDRFTGLVDALYGPDDNNVDIIFALRRRWLNHPILPVGSADPTVEGAVLRSPWLPQGFEDAQMRLLREWLQDARHGSAAHQQSVPMAKEAVGGALPGGDGLAVFLGPSAEQQRHDPSPGEILPLDTSGRPLEDVQARPAGFLVDIGGIPTSLDWAPRHGRVDQILAIAVIPRQDQTYHHKTGFPGKGAKDGHILLYRVGADLEDERAVHMRTLTTKLESVLGLGWGRPKRLQWCPVPIDNDSSYGRLAVICGDGLVRVVDVQKQDMPGRGEPSCQQIESPIVAVGPFPGETAIAATCFSWMDARRLAVGHSDGSISIWSLWPTFLVQRLRAQPTYILDVCSGYPSYPNAIASHAISGHSKLIDLDSPSCEVTFSGNPTLNFQPGLLRWCETMQGFISFYPATYSGNTSVGFMHVRHYARPRVVYTGYVVSTSLAIGAVHPYLLVGCADGSLWASNSIRKTLFDRRETLFKIKLLQHEFRPVGEGGGGLGETSRTATETPTRGAVRFLQGFAPDINDSIRARKVLAKERRKKANVAERKRPKGGAKRKARAQVPESGIDEEAESDAEAPDSDSDEIMEMDVPAVDEEKQDWEPEKRIVHEPLTRVSAVAWNPNLEFGWWAAAGMASGLVRIMELGVDQDDDGEAEGPGADDEPTREGGA